MPLPDTGGVRLTEFWRRLDEAVGTGAADTFATDRVIGTLGDRTVREALAAGVPANEVWRAVHVTLDLPARLR
jgi:hypothetical protein